MRNDVIDNVATGIEVRASRGLKKLTTVVLYRWVSCRWFVEC
jgi:hypothetical protein